MTRKYYDSILPGLWIALAEECEQLAKIARHAAENPDGTSSRPAAAEARDEVLNAMTILGLMEIQ